MSNLLVHALPDGSAEANAAAIMAGLVSWWALDDNAATPSFVDSHGGHHLTLRLGAATPNSSTQSSATSKQGRAWASGRADNGMLYLPRADTALDMTSDTIHTIGGWFKLDFSGATTAFVIGRIGSAFAKLHFWVTIDSVDGLIKARYSATGAATAATAASTIAAASGEWCLVIASYNRTAGTMTIRVRKETTGAMSSGSVALGAAISSVADNCNFTIGEGLEGDSSYDAVNNRSGVLTADECFYGAFAVTDAIFDYLFNAGAGRSYSQVVADTTTLPRGGFKLYEREGRLGIKVAHNASAAAYWSAWETTASFAPGSFYALAFEVHNGVPRIFVDGVEQAGAFLTGSGSQASFIGLDTTHTGYPLRVGAFDGWIDECSVDMTEAIYTADYTPEAEPFADPTAVTVFVVVPWIEDTLTVDRDPLGTMAGREPDITTNGFRWLDSGETALEIVDGLGASAPGTTNDILQWLTANDSLDDPLVPLGITLPWTSTVVMQKQSAVSASMYDAQEWRYYLTPDGSVLLQILWDQPGEFIGIGLDDGSEEPPFAATTTIEGGIGTLNVEMTVEAEGVTAVFTFSAPESSPVVETVSFAHDMTAFDDLHSVRLNATSGDGSKIYARFFSVSTEAASSGSGTMLILDRGLDWDGTPEPHAVMLSSEVNGVSAALLCERGDADHEVVLLEDAPFELFGKGEHQEPTRVAFGTLDNIVRDWIVTAVQPKPGLGVHVDGLVYNPDVYDGAMPHQGGEALPLPEPPGGWIIAGTPDSLAADIVIAGDPADPSADYVLAGAPDDPSTWLEPEGPP